MFLKSLTARGFKSFADKTVFCFEPGITAVVGPNGSGKSNLVDALSWVLGTRSPKVLRGSGLADVIFAGSPTRPGLGRAEVEMMIDNSSGYLGSGGVGVAGSAQGFSEVRISREILSTGENRYAINGANCRLLDVHELLSDTGLGRELHAIVCQGQLDSILQAKPEERRALVEEAAGILKHRQRRERAQRKLEHVALHVDKLRTVLRELRRQLKPLERQAEAANRSTQLQAELRTVRLRLAAHDLVRLRSDWQETCSHDTATAARQDAAEAAVVAAEGDRAAVEEQLRSDMQHVERARTCCEELGRLRERLLGTTGLAAVRRRHRLEDLEQTLAGRPPDGLRSQAERFDAERFARETARAHAQADLAAAAAASHAAQLARRDHEQRRAAATRERAEARERYTRFEGQVHAHRDMLAASEAESARLEVQLTELDGRVGEIEAELWRVQQESADLDEAEWQLTEALARAEREVVAAEAALEAASAQEREIEQARTAQAARAEALRTATADEVNGAVKLLASDLDGLHGLLADHVRVVPGGEAAVAAALGPFGGAIVADSRVEAERAVTELRLSQPVGRVAVLPLDLARQRDVPTLALPAQPVATLLVALNGDHRVLDATRRALAGIYVAESWSEAVALHAAHPGCTFVTRDGDVAGPFGFVGGRTPELSAVVAAAAAEEAERMVDELGTELTAAQAGVLAARETLAARRAELERATVAITTSHASITRASEQRTRLNHELTTIAAHRALVRAQRDELADTIARRRVALIELKAQEPPQPEDEAPGDARDKDDERLDDDVERTRTAELEARLAVERLNEQIRHLDDAACALRHEAAEVEQALASAARRRDVRRAQLRLCEDIAALCTEALAAAERALGEAERDRDRLERVRRRREEILSAARAHLDATIAERDQTREARHASALRRAAVHHELDELGRRVREAFGLSADEVVDEHPGAQDYERASLETSSETLQRKLDQLGRVNPLALEEFHALEERHAFLSRQLDDLLASKRDLEKVIRAVDDKI
ncbi:MAG: AAA family ATPase, partial [Actinomycetota bacterium]|nr:AAA family ATPase [Actinomycetota bacterium]